MLAEQADRRSIYVIPAKAGISLGACAPWPHEIPAFAGMTALVGGF